MDLPAPAVLFYDGTCGFCAASVQFVLQHDRQRTLRFAPLQGSLGARVRTARPELDGVDSIFWVEQGRPGEPLRVLVRSDAALRVVRYLGGPWRLGAVGRLVPRPLRDRLYDLIARHRHRLVGVGPNCLNPTPDVRERFLDIT